VLALVAAVLLAAVAGCGGSTPAPGDPPLAVDGLVEALVLEPGADQRFRAVVTRGDRPVRGAIVTLNVFLPQGGVRWYIGAPTDAEGRTFIRFRPTQPGVYFVEITAQQSGEVVTTSTGFRVRAPTDLSE